MNPIESSTAVYMKNVSFGYDRIPVLEKINLTIADGSFTGIIGPNGGGKTTLLKLMLGLIKPWSGQVAIFGQNPVHNRSSIGYVPQATAINRQFPISVRQTVALGRLAGKMPLFHKYSAQDNDRIEWCLDRLDIKDLAKRQIGQLSGGQWQRVLIARALAVNPRLLLLDEPSSGLDASSRTGVYELLQELNREMTIILVTHDAMVITAFIRDIVCINHTMYYHGEPDLSPHLMMQVYGCPVDLIAHGVPHRVLGEHGESL